MKLKELTEAIAKSCGVNTAVAVAVQDETFRHMRAELDKGEKVVVPDFGVFSIKESTDAAGAPKRSVRFRAKTEETKEARKAKKAKKAADKASEDGGEDA